MSSERTLPPPPARPAAWRWLVLAAALAVLVLVGFGRTAQGFFLADDFNVVYGASRVTALHEALDLRGEFRLRLIREILPDFPAPQSTLVRPLPTLTLWLDWLRSGTDSFGYRSSALALHALNALLVALLAHALSRSFAAATIAGALFALHPAQPEAVVWIAARADLLVGTFLALALLAWLRFLRSGRRAALLLACAGFAGALASKEMAAALPGVALALVPACAERRWRRAGLGALALAVVLLAYVGFRLACIGSLRAYHDPGGGVLGAAVNVLRFLRDALLASVWPGDRTAHPDPDALRVGFAAAAAALPILALTVWRQWLPAVLACALAAAVSTAPVAPWAGMAASGEGSRLLYPTLMLAAVAMATVGAAALRRRPLLAALALAGLAVATLLGLWRTLVPWQRAAATAHDLVYALRDAAAGKRTLVLSNDLPAQDGPAYLAQNAFPAAAMLFVRADVTIVWLTRGEWERAVVERRDALTRDPTLAALRWDAARRRWVGPAGN